MAEQELQEAALAVKIEFTTAIRKRHTSQRAVAKALGLAESQLSQAFSGSSRPRDIEIREAARKFLGMEEASK